MQAASTWAFEPAHTRIGFSVRHFGIAETEGFFQHYSGTVISTEADFSDAQVELTLEVGSLNTLDASRDQHLQSADFFDAAHHPQLYFSSTSLTPSASGHYLLQGDLTMRGITHPVSLDLVFGGVVPRDPFGHTKAGFYASGTLNRKDWGINWNTLLDTGGWAVSDTVTIRCQVELLLLTPAT
ncbi:MAG: YceI family protein [Bacteroidia bacterium]|nr:YceI family protein [Bacteroidia bacterium]